ncbi:helix-turn-helix domain-containing protein [Roseivirga sp.]|uniref:helix-turn-helix domain-containing protein n=1 Tax=Roseivirga sp. TaxID=1964215 RepID=UPI003B51A83E
MFFVKLIKLNKKSRILQVICLEEEAFFELVERVLERLNLNNQEPQKWVDQTEAMKLLNIKSQTTLQEYRNNGEIRYTQPRKRVILYDRDSINEFLEKHSKNTF